MPNQYVVTLTPRSDVQTGAAKDYTSVATGLIGDLACSLQMEELDFTSGDETYDVKIQHSPDREPNGPDPVSDSDAIWYDLVTFTQMVAGGGVAQTEHKDLTTPHYSRLRAVLTFGGTSPSAKVTVIVEGVPLGIL